jgi:nickel/cobalt transporter (NicO) family protein
VTFRAVGRRAVLFLALVACVLVMTGAVPALAHPWGPPPKAVVSGQHDRVVVKWQAEADDAVVLGVELGLLAPVLLDWTWDGPKERPGDADGPLLPPSGPLNAYLLGQIRVFQDGVACAGEVEPFGDFARDGATTVHTCPEPVEVVELEIGMLHDLHEAYRTFAASSGGAHPRQAVFTAVAPRHTWTFGGAAGPGGLWAAWAQMIATAVLAAVVMGLAVHRRRRRRARPTQGRPQGQGGGPPRELLRTGSQGIVPVTVLAAVDPQRFGWLEGEFVRLIDMEGVGLMVGVVALLVAFGIGAAHALAPGHGKGLISAYLVGTRGHRAHALALGSIVAVMHCASVLVFGGVLFTAVTLQTSAGQVLQWMSVAAGALVTAVGAGLVARHVRLRAAPSVLIAAHRASGNEYEHADEHAHDHAHQQLPVGVSPLSRHGVVALGVSGGLLPSPSGVLVLATAILMGRALFGFLLVAAFSLGLAATLTTFGLAAIKGHTLMERRSGGSRRVARLAAVLPLISSVAVLGGGVWITTMALLRL